MARETMSFYLKLLKLKSLIPTPIKSISKKALLYTRQFGEQRSLPDFIIIGVQKGGTTSLFTYLMRHPQILPPLHKQSFFFDRHFSKGVAFYKATFPLIKEKKKLSNKLNKKVITGEATPDYFFIPQVPKRIKSLAMETKFIVIFREPIERCISAYNYFPEYYEKNQNINEYFLKEIKSYKRIDFSKKYDINFTYFDKIPILSRSLYDIQYLHWKKYFNESKFLFIDNKDLKINYSQTMFKVEQFLEIDKFEIIDNTKYNTTNRQKDLPDENTMNELKEILDPHFIRFKQMIF